MAVSLGDTVEIICQEDVAKVAAKSTEKYVVEYTTLVMETDEKVYLKEIVDGHFVRPLPPEIKVSEFNMPEKVDVYADDGWWDGRVTRKNGSEYTVYFEIYRDSGTYPMSRLRPPSSGVC